MSQVYNDTMVKNLATHFPLRCDPALSLTRMIPTCLDLLYLRGLWAAGSVDENDAFYDLSGQGRTMYATSGLVSNMYSIETYAVLDALNTTYLRRHTEAGIEITGDLTIFGWFYFNAAATAEGLISKWLAAGNQRSFRLIKTVANTIQFQVSGDGAASVTVTSTPTVTTGAWYFLAGRYTWNTAIDVWVNPNMPGDFDTLAAGIPAALHNSTDYLEIGRTDAGSYLTGAVLLAGVCAGALTDTGVWNIYQQTRGMLL